MPFSIWPGGSLAVFSDIYVKIILIFALMMSTITSPRRVRQMTWIMIIASGYIASRAVFDYVRGMNLVEGNRVRGAVGGMFENPNDLALNLVTFLAPTLFIIFQDKKTSRRLFAAAIAAAMVAAIVCTKSRSGFLGLVGMGAVVLYYLAKVKPALVLGVLLAGLLALPVMPSSFWDRMDSIVNADEDETGSRAARLRLLEQGMEVFLENPITGIGAGQFRNYNAPGVVEKWRVTHNVWLQVAAELGVFGLLAFAFLVVRAYSSNFVALRILRGPRRRGSGAARRGWTPPPPVRDPQLDFSADERSILDINAKGMIAAMVGWTICALLRVGRLQLDVLLRARARRGGPRDRPQPPPRPAVATPAAAPAPLMVRATRMKRRILVDARTPVHYTMFAPVHAAMQADERVRFYFCASEEPAAAAAIFHDAGTDARLIGPAAAALIKFDAYLTSDFTWTRLLHRTCRIQMFHGVGGKYGFDAPTESLAAWHRLFFVNRRRLNNCIASGALDRRQPGDPPDRHAEGGRARRRIAQPRRPSSRRSASRRIGPTVLYAPTWSPASSLNTLGVALLQRLRTLPVNVIVKLHDRSCDLRPQYSGGVDWRAALQPHLADGSAVLASSADICPYLVASDVMVTDHSSAGFEYLLLDRPLVRIHVPELIALANIHKDYVQLLADVSESTSGVDDTVAAVERALADPAARSAMRRAVAADLFHEPGHGDRPLRRGALRGRAA